MDITEYAHVVLQLGPVFVQRSLVLSCLIVDHSDALIVYYHPVHPEKPADVVGILLLFSDQPPRRRGKIPLYLLFAYYRNDESFHLFVGIIRSGLIPDTAYDLLQSGFKAILHVVDEEQYSVDELTP